MRLYHTSAAVLEKLCLTTLKIELDLADLLRAGGYRLDALRAAEPAWSSRFICTIEGGVSGCFGRYPWAGW